MLRRSSPSLLVVLLAVLVTAVVSVNGLWIGEKGDGWKGTVRSDVKGYYGYLQSLFIRNDHGHEPYVWEYVRYTDDGRTVNKYFCGTSVMMAPWFGIGHAIALSDPEAPKDGLSIHEMRALSIGAWVYLLLGLLALRALLLGIGVREGAVAWTLAAIALGTQLMQYAALQPGWSHIHTFCAVSVFLLVIHRLHRDASVWLWVAAAALLGLVVLIRPVNGLVVLAIPVVAGQDTWALLRGLLQRPWVLIGAVVMGMAVVGIQPLLWYMQTGRWFAYGYQGEGFHWDRPEVFKVLFGFRRGLFLWAPVLLLALFGTLRMLRKERPRGLGMLVYWAANTYVISSWWIWYYGSGFGSRVFVDHYPVLAIPMALLLNDLRGRWWTLTRTYIVACIVLLGIQMWQYHMHILHHESMDRRKYAFTFLRSGEEYRHLLGGNYQSAPYNPNGMEVVLEESCDLERECTWWKGGRIQERHEAFSGRKVCVFNDSTEYGITFIAEPGSLPTGRALFLEVGLQRYEANAGDSRTLLGITEVKHADGSSGYYEPFRINPMPPVPGQWEQLEYRIPVPPLEEGDRLSFYFWNKDRDAHVLIDDVFMRVSAVRPY
jgi:hypothetical protein